MVAIKKYWIIIVIAFGLSMFIKPALCFIIGGSVIFYLSCNVIFFLRKIHRYGIQCTGKITDYQIDNKGYKIPFVEFTTASGKLIKGKPYFNVSTDFSKIMWSKDIEVTVSVLYDPYSPEKFILFKDNMSNSIFLIILSLFSLGFIIIGIGNLIGYIKFG